MFVFLIEDCKVLVLEGLFLKIVMLIDVVCLREGKVWSNLGLFCMSMLSVRFLGGDVRSVCNIVELVLFVVLRRVYIGIIYLMV